MSDNNCPPFRRNSLSSALLLFCLVSLGAWTGQAQSPFELKDGDRVAFLGDTFFERAIRYGHIETALTTRWPDREIVFRNIGWSGDAPDGRARAFFETVEAGFENLKTHVQLANPSVVFLSYGAMAAFEGSAGLDRFIRNMNTLIDTIAESDVRLVILSPPPRETLEAPLPDSKAQNRNLALYTKALRSLAKEREAHFVDLFNSLETRSESRGTKAITDNGVHLNDYGYFLAAERIAQSLAEYPATKALSLEKNGALKDAAGVTLLEAIESEAGLTISLLDDRLSLSQLSGDFAQNLSLALADLPRGNYSLEYEGRVLATGSAQKWERGIQLAWEPSNDQAIELRETIKKKNALFFHQWRPQNETYIRGFRKHEQGQNVADLPKFDPFIESEEMKIDLLKKPRAYTLTLKREKGGEG